MRTRSQSRNSNRQQQQVNPTFVEPFNLVEPIENQALPVVTMDDTRTMAQLLEAPIVGYEDAIVVPENTADNFKLKHVPILVTMGCQKPSHLAERLGCAETKVATWDDLAFKLIILGWNVRIMQKSQENGQNQTNTDTGTDRVHKSQKFQAKGHQKSTLGQPLVNS
ncbi:hypothetical protein Tco_1266762 [Tanacetum coccineum]